MLLQPKPIYLPSPSYSLSQAQNVMQYKGQDAETTLHLAESNDFARQRLRLAPLKTCAELRTAEEVVEALVVRIPIKLANRVQKLLQPLFPSSAITRSFTHLRRFSAFPHLPAQLRAIYDGRNGSKRTIFLVLPPPLPISPEVSIPATLEPYLEGQNLDIRRISVPVDPPTSTAQSAEWSTKYWPCVFNPSAQPLQNAPPLHTLRPVTEELEADNLTQAEKFMNLAEKVAEATKESGQGRKIGAVIVDPEDREVVVVAGDQRWSDRDCIRLDRAKCEGEGRPECHSLMRAIDFVAAKERKRRGLDAASDLNATQQFTSIEKHFFELDKSTVSDGSERVGYLCHGLDVYMTHEPCVCCSMALIHSRFRVCVFKRRMVGTGGLCAEQANGGLGYGMFWRRELNWRTLTFQFLDVSEGDLVGKSSGAREEIYHA